mmetsp:Transcript_106721/g.311988  ORF Transcript_106721/g.311988 Transcript_106721/m.311988 type:complete len:304 (+) Transcript_106721:2849-3760(+)
MIARPRDAHIKQKIQGAQQQQTRPSRGIPPQEPPQHGALLGLPQRYAALRTYLQLLGEGTSVHLARCLIPRQRIHHVKCSSAWQDAPRLTEQLNDLSARSLAASRGQEGVGGGAPSLAAGRQHTRTYPSALLQALQPRLDVRKVHELGAHLDQCVAAPVELDRVAARHRQDLDDVLCAVVAAGVGANALLAAGLVPTHHGGTTDAELPDRTRLQKQIGRAALCQRQHGKVKTVNDLEDGVSALLQRTITVEAQPVFGADEQFHQPDACTSPPCRHRRWHCFTPGEGTSHARQFLRSQLRQHTR